MHWWLLCGAIVLEVFGTTAMKASNGFEKMVPSVLMVIFYVASFLVLGKSMTKIDVGVAYAIWSGVGTALIALIGVWWFREPISTLKVLCLVLIVAGVVGLKYDSGS